MCTVLRLLTFVLIIVCEYKKLTVYIESTKLRKKIFFFFGETLYERKRRLLVSLGGSD